nr:splicing factor [Tanacetum cinerariifolium]
MGRDQVFTVNLHHDGIFAPIPLKYAHANGVLSSGSSVEYYSSDECDEIEGVEFQTEGEDNVVIKNLSIQDPFLNRLCTNSGLFRGFVDGPVPQTEGDTLEDPDDANIDPSCKAKKGVAFPKHDLIVPWNQMTSVLESSRLAKSAKTDKSTSKSAQSAKTDASTSKSPKSADQVFTVNLHHDGIFAPIPLKYAHGDEKQITDINFEGMSYVQFRDIIIHLVHGIVYKLYYSPIKTPLNVGIREIKTDNDVDEFLRLGGFVDGPVPQTEGDTLEDPDDANINPSCKAKKGVAFPKHDLIVPWNQMTSVL